MTVAERSLTEYISQIEDWREDMERQLRAENGWLTVVGLDWLHEGENTVGSDPSSTVLLPESLPRLVGVINFQDGKTAFQALADEPVLVDGEDVQTADLRHDHTADGPSLVKIGSVTFNVIKRGEQYGVRVRDANSEARKTFEGRDWFPIDARCRVNAAFTAHPTGRKMELENSIGSHTELTNPGYIDFSLHGQTFRLEAFDGGEMRLWVIFRDATSGTSTYSAGRFLYADMDENGSVDLDFNKAYHPPCAFTHYATCPLPPRQNVLPMAIMAGERFKQA